MNSLKNAALLLLAIAATVLAAVEWRQYRELLALRAQVAADDSAGLKRQLAAAQKTIKSLQDRMLAQRGRRGGPEGEGPDGGEGPGGPGENPRNRGGRFGAFATLNGNPEFQKLVAIQMKGRISQQYAALFKVLNLSPDQLNQFQGLLADKQQALMDTLQAAREQGINPRDDPEGFKALVTQAEAQTDQSIQQSLGDAGFQAYQQYQQTMPERNTVNSLQTSLSYTNTPLTDDEANQMISLLAANQPERAGNGTVGAGAGGPGGVMALMNGGGTAKVTADAVTQAAGVLSGPQVAALQAIQQQQQAQQQMQQMMRSANQASAPPPAAGAAPTKG